MARTQFDVGRFNRHLALLPEQAVEALKTELVRGADEAVTRIKANLPTGPDKNGHIKDTVKASPGRTALTIDVSMGSADQPYPGALEWGHMVHGKHVPATPVFFPAVKIAKRRTRARMKRAFKKVMKGLFGGAS